MPPKQAQPEELERIKREVEIEFGMGGLSDGLYGDYASEVAKRYAGTPLPEYIREGIRTTMENRQRALEERERNFPNRQFISHDGEILEITEVLDTDREAPVAQCADTPIT